MISCSIIIVNYNTKDWLKRYIDSIIRFTIGVSYEIIVIDNNSPDGSADMIRTKYPDDVILIANKENIYTSKGFNQGIAIAKGRYIFISDADLELKNNILANILTYMETNKIAIAGAPFHNSDGSMQQGYSRDFNFPFALLNYTFLGKLMPKTAKLFRDDFEYAGWDRRGSADIDICDTALMISRDVLNIIQYFGIDPYTEKAKCIYDEGLTMYCHNQLLCWKAKKIGFKIKYLYLPDSIIHDNHSSVNKESWLKISKIYRKDLHYFFTQIFGVVPAWTIRILMNITGIGLYVAWAFGWYEPKKSIAFGLS